MSMSRKVERATVKAESASEVFKPARGPEAAGCVALISSGTSSRESAFLDASGVGLGAKKAKTLPDGCAVDQRGHRQRVRHLRRAYLFRRIALSAIAGRCVGAVRGSGVVPRLVGPAAGKLRAAGERDVLWYGKSGAPRGGHHWQVHDHEPRSEAKHALAACKRRASGRGPRASERPWGALGSSQASRPRSAGGVGSHEHRLSASKSRRSAFLSRVGSPMGGRPYRGLEPAHGSNGVGRACRGALVEGRL